MSWSKVYKAFLRPSAGLCGDGSSIPSMVQTTRNIEASYPIMEYGPVSVEISLAAISGTGGKSMAEVRCNMR